MSLRIEWEENETAKRQLVNRGQSPRLTGAGSTQADLQVLS
jgi:hypothetical protein